MGIVFILTLFCGCGSMHPVVSQPPPGVPSFINAITQIKRSVIPVVCVQIPQVGEPRLISVEGTAFFVRADGTFATAGHVVRGLASPDRINPCPTAAIYIPRNGWQPQAATLRIAYFYFTAANCIRDDE